MGRGVAALLAGIGTGYMAGQRMESERRREERETERFGFERRRMEREEKDQEIIDGIREAARSAYVGLADSAPDADPQEKMLASLDAGWQYALKVGRHDKAAPMWKDAATLRTELRNKELGKVWPEYEASGDLTVLFPAYNKYVPDGKTISGERNADGSYRIAVSGGDKSREITVPAEKAASYAMALRDNEAMMKIEMARLQDLARQNTPKGRADIDLTKAQTKSAEQTARSSAVHAGVAAAGERRAAAKDKEKADAAAAGVSLFKEQNPAATPAQLEAVRTGVLPAAPKDDGYKTEFSEVATALGTPAKDEQGKPIVDMMTGRQVVNRNIAEEQKFFKWAREKGIKDTNKALAIYLSEKGGGGQAQPANETDAHAQANAAISAGASKAAVNARLKKMGYRELP